MVPHNAAEINESTDAATSRKDCKALSSHTSQFPVTV
ncbi:hypothetical protein OOU_Y34scaffold00136g1 [Pyricularia oryzae Y34]|uniref:Uncharacterized protein n=2 Tax=Pyricularia oryzae TaxID=318829 RepID=A0AA97PR05_PYRO3|nr:hypothetical protein OOU_Y34scaffold00136g1 [Pyricularia oryzae Y34]